MKRKSSEFSWGGGSKAKAKPRPNPVSAKSPKGSTPSVMSKLPKRSSRGR